VVGGVGGRGQVQIETDGQDGREATHHQDDFPLNDLLDTAGELAVHIFGTAVNKPDAMQTRGGAIEFGARGCTRMCVGLYSEWVCCRMRTCL